MPTVRHNRFRAARRAALIAALAFFAVQPVLAAPRTPNDTYYSEQWYLPFIGATEAWNSSLGLESVPIAIIDSGVDIDHPDLRPNIWHNPGEIAGNGIDDDNNGYVDDSDGWDFVSDDNDPRPDISGDFTVLGVNHGTVNAGVAAARGDNARGIAGVSWSSTIMALRALDSHGEGDPARIARAVDYAVKNGAKIINISFTGTLQDARVTSALRRAYDAGVFIVAAAGNGDSSGKGIDLDKNPQYPICLDAGSDENFIYGVAATDEYDTKAPFSNYGAGCVDGSAPGVRILSTQLYRLGTKYFGSAYGGFYNGTSVAAPVVSGTVALLRALDRNLTPKQLTNILTETSVRIDAKNVDFFGKLGRGRIDALKAVQAVLAMQRGPVNPQTTASLLPPGYTGGFIIAAPGAGRAANVRMFTEDGTFLREFAAYPTGFTGGLSLALANVDKSGKNVMVTGAGPGGAPQVRIFDRNTKPIGGFMAYDALFKGGVSVAAGDVDGDGIDEIITGAGTGGGPQVRVFKPNGIVASGFFAFAVSRRAGIDVTAADLDGDGKSEILVSAPDLAMVRVYSGSGKLLKELQPFGKGVKRGTMRVSVVRGTDGVLQVVGIKPTFGGMAAVEGAPQKAQALSVQAYERSFKSAVRALYLP